ncbi:TPA: helix-turn-helix domain-containing protein [Proteus mirabilis]|nr:helix-turn-helix transcriptional regulator [Proteus mirabilis]
MSNKYPVAYAVGQKIKSLRKSQGYTVFQLAKEIDISEQQLFRYERGVNRIDIDCLHRMVHVKVAEYHKINSLFGGSLYRDFHPL